jgi:TetR/AcrR family transcriptional regulator
LARPRSSGYDDQRAAILGAAAQLFASQGYPATAMSAVAAACGVSKPTLYHYVRDKHDLLAQIAEGHVARLEALVAEVRAEGLAAETPEAHLRALIVRFMHAYAGAQHEHRVLTEDVRFLAPAPRRAVLDGQRRVVAAFAEAIAALRPELAQAGEVALAKPLAMLLFGMLNWTFTWLKDGGALSHAALAGVVCDLFFGGLNAVRAPQPAARAAPARRAPSLPRPAPARAKASRGRAAGSRPRPPAGHRSPPRRG